MDVIAGQQDQVSLERIRRLDDLTHVIDRQIRSEMDVRELHDAEAVELGRQIAEAERALRYAEPARLEEDRPCRDACGAGDGESAGMDEETSPAGCRRRRIVTRLRLRRSARRWLLRHRE